MSEDRSHINLEKWWVWVKDTKYLLDLRNSYANPELQQIPVDLTMTVEPRKSPSHPGRKILI